MQETQIQSLIWEDLTCFRATKPMCHNYWACTLEPVSHSYWNPPVPEPCAPQQEKPLQWEAHVPQLGSKPRVPQLRKAPAATKTQQPKPKIKKLKCKKKDNAMNRKDTVKRWDCFKREKRKGPHPPPKKQKKGNVTSNLNTHMQPVQMVSLTVEILEILIQKIRRMKRTYTKNIMFCFSWIWQLTPKWGRKKADARTVV